VAERAVDLNVDEAGGDDAVAGVEEPGGRRGAVLDRGDASVGEGEGEAGIFAGSGAAAPEAWKGLHLASVEPDGP